MSVRRGIAEKDWSFFIRETVSIWHVSDIVDINIQLLSDNTLTDTDIASEL